ncbi:hypothetical protein KO481_10780 [Nocardia sp. NEAU-G5]|uniref:Major facilitator superfamily (MFS) profile domain-containing protein n=1 Tax=Nocardia albiluteola TaxID=2842303 RepID=A0ABS6AVE5_9NOCA|nr:hypothetical protein [Nocardia albiluteola]MBU3062007.1 hypothetical protein [Nocardia albiluteola]
MALAHSAWIACLARICAGLSVGLVTGSPAGLILERRGERGRTAMASATVFGSALGIFAAATVAQYLPAPGVTVYLAHAIALGLVTALVLSDRAAPAAAAMSTAPAPAADRV